MRAPLVKRMPPKNALRSWGQQLQQGAQNFPILSHIDQLSLGNPEAFPGQCGDVISPPSPDTSSQLDVPGTPPKGGAQGASLPGSQTNSTGFFRRKGSAALLRDRHRWLLTLSLRETPATQPSWGNLFWMLLLATSFFGSWWPNFHDHRWGYKRKLTGKSRALPSSSARFLWQRCDTVNEIPPTAPVHSQGCLRNSPRGVSWRSRRQGPPPNNPSSPTAWPTPEKSPSPVFPLGFSLAVGVVLSEHAN